MDDKCAKGWYVMDYPKNPYFNLDRSHEDRGEMTKVVIENDRQLQIAEQRIRILEAEKADWGIPDDEISQAAVSSIELSMSMIQKEIDAYKAHKEHFNIK